MTACTLPTQTTQLNEENYMAHYLRFNDRQAGIGLVYCPQEDRYAYNVYCIDFLLMKELFSVECEFLEDALELVQQEFGTWELVAYEKKNCSDCSAK